MLDSGAVQAALLPDGEGIVAFRRPLAIVAPFSSDWDDVSLQQARQILAEGHDVLAVVPWDDLTPRLRPLTIDGRELLDADYPLQEQWSLHAVPEVQDAARAFAGQLERSSGDATVKLAAVGDVMLDRELGQAIAAGDITYPFDYVANVLQDADLTIANLESALGDRGEPVNKSYTFRAPPAAAQSLALAGIDLVSLANNHALDYGPEALSQGMTLLQEQGVATVGAGLDAERAHRPHVTTVNGITLAFLGYTSVPVEGRAPYFDTATWAAGPQTPGLAWADPDVIVSDVELAVREADHVIVILHSGYEYVPSPSPEQVNAAHAAIDAGATLVIGHHAHILQGVEFRAGGTIVYGLGNFAFNITGPPETVILQVWLDAQELRSLRFIPAIIGATGQPRPVDGEDAIAIRRRIYTLSRYLN
jgi:poly-gamma-glutamate capsule biosynthesis protein CapA/YwtB (metallophosphatase superfamily)